MLPRSHGPRAGSSLEGGRLGRCEGPDHALSDARPFPQPWRANRETSSSSSSGSSSARARGEETHATPVEWATSPSGDGRLQDSLVAILYYLADHFRYPYASPPSPGYQVGLPDGLTSQSLAASRVKVLSVCPRRLPPIGNVSQLLAPGDFPDMEPSWVPDRGVGKTRPTVQTAALLFITIFMPFLFSIVAVHPKRLCVATDPKA